ncbi:urea transporter [Streptomyces sp. NPDC032161]|uniref:urea transporter n=1 Tax=unclassified Streptomyces TaxID=2593676 RepID=UPI0033E3659F
MLVAEQKARPGKWSPAHAGRIPMRGISQVALLSNSWSGLLFVVALFVCDWRIGVYGLLGTASSTAAAALLGADRGGLAAGLQGYCGCLTGIALAVRLGVSWQTAALAVLGGAACAVLVAATGRLLGPLGLPVLTAPYCLVAGVLVAALSKTPVTDGPSLRVPGFTELTLADAGRALCDNIGQIFYLDRWYAGLIVLAGILLASRVAAPAAAHRRAGPGSPQELTRPVPAPPRRCPGPAAARPPVSSGTGLRDDRDAARAAPRRTVGSSGGPP